MPLDRSISVVIPTFRDDIALELLLEDLSKHSVSEIIICDAEIRPIPDFILKASVASNIRYIHAPKGRGPQIKRGIETSHEKLIWVLHADSTPHRNSVEDIRITMSDKDISLGCFPIRFMKSSPILAGFAYFSKFDSRFSSFGDQGFFFRRDDYDKLRLDLSDYPLLEDMALRTALKTLGRVRKSNLKLETSARRFRKFGPLRTQAYNMAILFRFWRGESPSKLYQRYYGTIPQTTQSHPPSSIAHQV